MGRNGLVCVLCCVLFAGLLAGTVIDEDFRLGVTPGWELSGDAHHAGGVGIVLVDFGSFGAGLAAWDMPLVSNGVRVSFRLRIEAGPQGWGDGFVMGLVDTAHVPSVGTGGGMLGVGNLSSCAAALLVEFDTFPSAPGDAGSVDAPFFHAGIATSTAGDTHLESVAAVDIGRMAVSTELIDLAVEVTINDSRVTVCAGREGEPLGHVLTQDLAGAMPREGYLVFAAAQDGLPARVSLVRAAVEDEMPAPPVLQARADAEGGVHVAWDVGGEVFDELVLSRDGEEIALMAGASGTLSDTPGSVARHRYELRARRTGGVWAAPVAAHVVTGRPWLVVDRVRTGEAPSPHAAAWCYELAQLGRPVVRAGGVAGLDLSQFAAVVWIAGTNPFTPSLCGQEAEALARHIHGGDGVRLLVEGSDVWTLCAGGLPDLRVGAVPMHAGWPATTVFDALGRACSYVGHYVRVTELAAAPGHWEGASWTELWRRSLPDDPDSAGAPIVIATRTPRNEKILIAAALELCRFQDETERAAAAADYVWLLEQPVQRPQFRRGDASGDGAVNIADAIVILGYLFAGEAEPSCLDAADVNDDGEVQISDAIALLGYLFSGGAIAAPGPLTCGEDPTPDKLPLCVYPACP